MAIKKVKLVNIVVPEKNSKSLLRSLIVKGDIEFADAKKMIDETIFLLKADEEHVQEILELNNIRDYKYDFEYNELSQKLSSIDSMHSYNHYVDIDYLKSDPKKLEDEDKINDLHKSLLEKHSRVDKLKRILDDLEPYVFIEKLGLLDRLSKLFNMEYFNTKLGYIDSFTYNRLRKNAYNIPGIFIHLYSGQKKELCLFSYPEEMSVEIGRILTSVRFDEIYFNKDYKNIDNRNLLYGMIAEKTSEKNSLQESIDNEFRNLERVIIKAHSHVSIEKLIKENESKIASADNFVYISIWAVLDDLDQISELIKYNNGQRIIIDSKDAANIERPPTLLNNNRLFSPFENLVELYAVPSYTEIDPTPFLAVFYMLLFGIMFGDLGQGFIFVIAGIFIKRKGNQFGSILTRIGISSMIFGFFYDSFFGYENFISKLIPISIYIRPFDNQNTMLIAGVILGQILLIFAYSFGILNAAKQKKYEELLFGKNGISGLVLFTMFLFLISDIVGFNIIPRNIVYIFSIISIISMLLKEPLYNLITNTRPLHENSISDYYVEHGFEILEILLSMLSNSLSFIRVGAFALNHVGLFIAFHTIANMINSSGGDIVIGIFANILILVLEGLVVSIQGLRLMYYEFFGKFFEGEGRKFKKVKLEELK